MMKSKITAAQIISDILLQKGSLSSKFPLAASVERHALIQEICFGVCRWFYRLDFIAKQLLKKSFGSKDDDIYALILIGLYQLIYMKTPENIVVSESVDAVKKINKSWAAGLVNATLRNFLRQKDSLLQKAEKNILAKYAHPQWLADKIKTVYPENWESILTANNQHPPLSLRMNRLKISREDYLKKLTSDKIAAFASTESHCGIILEKPIDVKKLPGFEQGEFFVQDCGAQLAGELLDLKPGQCVLDACAAPGGKTTHLFEIEPKIKKLVAIDREESRLIKIKDNWKRLFKDIKTTLELSIKTADVAHIKSWWDHELFDRILLDAPCSATGIIRRHPDIKLLKQKSNVKLLAEQQLQLLTALWPTLKPSGKLLYVTCSILPDENEQVIEQFLEKTAGAEEIKITAHWGIEKKFGRQLIPGQQNDDGFYFALLLKSPAIIHHQ